MNSRQENGSKLSFTARSLTKYYLERFCLFAMRKCLKPGFLKFCKLTSNLMILGQIIVSNRTNVNKLIINSGINYARLHWIRYKKQTSNTIITQAYHSRCNPWKLSSKAIIASDFSTLLRIKQGEKRKRCDPKWDFRLWQATYFSTKNPLNKVATNNRRLLIAAEFHFLYTQ